MSLFYIFSFLSNRFSLCDDHKRSKRKERERSVCVSVQNEKKKEKNAFAKYVFLFWIRSDIASYWNVCIFFCVQGMKRKEEKKNCFYFSSERQPQYGLFLSKWKEDKKIHKSSSVTDETVFPFNFVQYEMPLKRLILYWLCYNICLGHISFYWCIYFLFYFIFVEFWVRFLSFVICEDTQTPSMWILLLKKKENICPTNEIIITVFGYHFNLKRKHLNQHDFFSFFHFYCFHSSFASIHFISF